MRQVYFMTAVFCLAVLDILCTFHNARILKKHKKNWEHTEYNPLVRTSWHIFGLLNGTIIAAAITLSGILLVAYLIGERELLQGFLLGAYVIVHHYHYMNHAYIMRRYRKRKSDIIDKILSNI